MPAADAGGIGAVTLSYYANDTVRSESQGTVGAQQVTTYSIDPLRSARQHDWWKYYIQYDPALRELELRQQRGSELDRHELQRNLWLESQPDHDRRTPLVTVSWHTSSDFWTAQYQFMRTIEAQVGWKVGGSTYSGEVTPLQLGSRAA